MINVFFVLGQGPRGVEEGGGFQLVRPGRTPVTNLDQVPNQVQKLLPATQHVDLSGRHQRGLCRNHLVDRVPGQFDPLEVLGRVAQNQPLFFLPFHNPRELLAVVHEDRHRFETLADHLGRFQDRLDQVRVADLVGKFRQVGAQAMALFVRQVAACAGKLLLVKHNRAPRGVPRLPRRAGQSLRTLRPQSLLQRLPRRVVQQAQPADQTKQHQANGPEHLWFFFRRPFRCPSLLNQRFL